MELWIRLARLIDRLNDHFATLATWAVLLSCLICVGNALAHAAYDVGSNAWLEIQWYLFAMTVMLGAAKTLKHNEHVRVDIFYSRLSARGKLWLDLVGALLFLLPVCGVFVWLSWPLFLDAFQTGEMSSNAGGLIRWPFKALVPLGFTLLAAQGGSELIKRSVALLRDTASDATEARYQRPTQ